MNTPELNSAKRSRWLDWQPNGRISADSLGSEPTKPGFVGFVGATSAGSRIIHPAPDCQQSLEQILKGHAVCLYSDLVGENLWIVADEVDAERLIEQGERRGAIYTRTESRLVTRIDHPEIVKQVHAFKREFNTRMLPPDDGE